MSRSSCGNNICPHWKAKQTASKVHGDTSARLSYVAAALTVQNTMVMMLHTRHTMHCMCNVTLWRVSVTTVAMETQQQFPFSGVPAPACNIKEFIVAKEMQQWVPFALLSIYKIFNCF
jgi:hypothetical protein